MAAANTAAAMPTSCGAWPSPISGELISKSLSAPYIAANGDLLWVEGRPAEKGRQVLVRRPASSGAPSDVTPGPGSGLNVSTRVQEYGGGQFAIGASDVYFANFGDQRLYRQPLLPSVGTPAPLTAEGSKLRFADGEVDAARNRRVLGGWRRAVQPGQAGEVSSALVCVVEDHSVEGEAVTTIGAVDLATGAVTTLASGSDFYSSPRLSPDGSKLVWISWEHPNMPWDDTALWVADVAADGSLSNHRQVAGGEGESVMHPQWSADGRLHFISDAPTGWWNVFALGTGGEAKAVCPMRAQVLSDGRLLAVYSDPQRAGANLALLDPRTNAVTGERSLPAGAQLGAGVESSCCARFCFRGCSVQEEGGRTTVLTVGGLAWQPAAVVKLEAPSIDALPQTGPADWEVVTKSTTLEVDPGYLSAPQAIEFPTEGGLTAYANYYPPTNKDCSLVMFEGEQHGFHQAANIRWAWGRCDSAGRRALDGELYFYARALGFPASMPPGLEPPAIEPGGVTGVAHPVSHGRARLRTD
eukprot:scaffold9.g3086.t1